MPRPILHRLAWVAFATLAFVPVRLATAQNPVQHMAFATHAIARGAVLTTEDFQYRDTTSATRAPLDSSAIGAGWVTRRTIAAGEVLREPAVEPPNLVVANQSVEIEFTDDNVCLTLRGTATRNGALGERITVRTDQGKRIEGTVVAAGRVRID